MSYSRSDKEKAHTTHHHHLPVEERQEEDEEEKRGREKENYPSWLLYDQETKIQEETKL